MDTSGSLPLRVYSSVWQMPSFEVRNEEEE